MSIYATGFTLGYSLFLALVVGAVFGSFLNCVAWRVAHREPWWTGRSRCPVCGHVLGLPDLVPVVSWLALKGRCRHCGTKVPVRYLCTELVFALLTAACLLRFDLSVLCLRNWVFLGCLFCLSLVDLEILEIPDELLLTGAGAWLVCLPFAGMRWQSAAVHLLTGFGVGACLLGLSLVMDRILQKDSLGGGDIKLFALVGLYLGPAAAMFAVLLSAVLGLLFLALLRSRGSRSEQFPFGPSIAAAAAVMLLWGEPLVTWYLSLVGLV